MRPHAVCLVPEKRTERTTEGGLDAVKQRKQLAPVVHELKAAGIRVSLFIAAQPAQIEAAAELGAPVIEIHTGAWCDALSEGHRHEADAEWQLIRAGAVLAKSLGLEVHAGHGLDYASAETHRVAAADRRTQYRPLPDRRGGVRRLGRNREIHARGHGSRAGEGQRMIPKVGSGFRTRSCAGKA